MERKGFTLAELLITVGIVGVVAVIAGPALSNVMPNKDKIQAINAYNAINEITSNLLDNETIYYQSRGSDGKPTCFGLACQQKPLVAPYNKNNFKGTDKFKNLVADSLKIKSTSTTGFETTDGIVWTFESNSSANNKITIDLNGDKGNNCSYSSDCSNPDSYEFFVDVCGNLIPGDPLLEAYLKNPTNNSNKKEDIKTAKELLKESEYPTLDKMKSYGDAVE